jgi:hypothetical protein
VILRHLGPGLIDRLLALLSWSWVNKRRFSPDFKPDDFEVLVICGHSCRALENLFAELHTEVAADESDGAQKRSKNQIAMMTQRGGSHPP